MFLCHRHVLILFIGVACLELFIQYNWTGPKPNLDPGLANNGQANQQLLGTLSQDGQVCIPWQFLKLRPDQNLHS